MNNPTLLIILLILCIAGAIIQAYRYGHTRGYYAGVQDLMRVIDDTIKKDKVEENGTV